MTQTKTLKYENLLIRIETEKNHTLNVFFEGEIHENFKSKLIVMPQSPSYVINLSGLRSINSLGIREWSQFINDLSRSASVTLEDCSVIFIDQANIVPTILGSARVSSFFAPYFCPKCHLELSCKLLISTHRKRLSEKRAPQLIHSCGTELQFDALEESYFAQAERLLLEK
jgi:hypothetical protein